MLRILLEQAKIKILNYEDAQGWKRVKAEFNLYEEWKKKYNKYSAQKTAGKLIIQKIKTKVVDQSIDIVTDLEALRHLLEHELDRFRIKKLSYRTNFKLANSLYFPYLFKCGEFRDIYYKVDIKSCFYEIYSRLGVDCKAIVEQKNSHFRIKAIAKGRINNQESELIRMLKKDKKLRNSVYGLTRCAFYTKLIPVNSIERCFFRPRLQNLDLTVIIAAFLHAFVSKFRKFILYWNIDGGIIAPEAYEKMKKYLLELGFELKKEAEGEAVILGLGSYKIGEYETVHFTNGVCSHLGEKEYLLNFAEVEKIENWFRMLTGG